MLNRRTGFATVTLTLLLAGCGGGGGGSSPSNPPPAAPSITTQPVSQTVNAGTDVTFTVAATGATSYQWQRNGTAISGATGASYSLSPATSANNGDAYVVVASNAGGNATSSAATLRVIDLLETSPELRERVHANARHFRLFSVAPVGLGLRLYTGDAVEDDDRTVEHAHRALHFRCEVDVPGSVDNIESHLPRCIRYRHI